jgi:hypothetical protein
MFNMSPQFLNNAYTCEKHLPVEILYMYCTYIYLLNDLSCGFIYLRKLSTNGRYFFYIYLWRIYSSKYLPAISTCEKYDHIEESTRKSRQPVETIYPESYQRCERFPLAESVSCTLHVDGVPV